MLSVCSPSHHNTTLNCPKVWTGALTPFSLKKILVALEDQLRAHRGILSAKVCIVYITCDLRISLTAAFWKQRCGLRPHELRTPSVIRIFLSTCALGLGQFDLWSISFYGGGIVSEMTRGTAIGAKTHRGVS